MSDQSAEIQMIQKITAYWISQSLYAAAKLGVADLLKDGPRSIDDLAQATGAKADWLYRLLRALASEGVFEEDDNRCFQLTPAAELLRTDVPRSQHALALMMGAPGHYAAWGELAEVVKTGENAFEKLFGKPVFDYLGEHPEEARTFDAAMTGINGRETGAVLSGYDFSAYGVIADIGGGNGSNLIALLRQYSQVRGILFDLPHVIERARPLIEEAGLADRCELRAGSFFDSVPAGADAYLMRHIIHDWDDEKSLAILGCIRRVIAPTGKVLVLEAVIPPGNRPFSAKFLDLNMMLIPGGKERTEAEYRELFQQSGFALARIVRTCMEISVVEAVPV
ncbi:methyltransferase [Planctomicrobium sp. SH664]|uniref:methyltransferase n=1 Tax=Planctomicrobium sp. SH664 TaxID=3448125 RepID=UPI003F5C782E